jgi:hypothetical protein
VELADQYVQNTEPVIAALHVGTRYIGQGFAKVGVTVSG